MTTPGPIVITRVGNEGLVGPAMEYLTNLGIPSADIKGIRIDAPSGDVQTVTVNLIVRKGSADA